MGCLCSLERRKVIAVAVIQAGESFDNGCESCVNKVSFVAGPVLVFIGFLLVFGLSGLGILFVIPHNFPHSAFVFQTFVSVGVLNICARYIFAVGTNPGTPSSSAFQQLVQDNNNDDDDVHPMLKWTTCRHSKLKKPPRCHFDRTLGQLVLNFDHWCPWLFNAVGYLNYRHFVWLLIWVWILTLFGTLLSLQVCLRVLKQGRFLIENVDRECTLVCLFCSVLCCAVSLLLGWHLFLVCSGQTAIDYLVLKGRRKREGYDFVNPFDSGSWWTNFNLVMFSQNGGDWKWLEAIIPPHPKRGPLGKPYPTAVYMS